MAVMNDGVVISRVEAANGKAVNLQTPVRRGLDLNKRVQKTLPTLAPKKDKHVDLMGIKSSPESIADADKTLTVEENVDLGSDPSNVTFLPLTAAAAKTTSASSALGQAKAPPVDTSAPRRSQIKQRKGIEMPVTATAAPQWGERASISHGCPVREACLRRARKRDHKVCHGRSCSPRGKHASINHDGQI
jgi:hypothetical protein